MLVHERERYRTVDNWIAGWNALLAYGAKSHAVRSRGFERGVLLPPGQYRKPRDVAQQLDVTLQTVYAWIQSGALPSVLLSPRARRIKQEDLDYFLATRRQGGEAA